MALSPLESHPSEPEFTDRDFDRAIVYLQQCEIGSGIVYIGQSLEARRIVQFFEKKGPHRARIQAGICTGFGESRILVLERLGNPEEPHMTTSGTVLESTPGFLNVLRTTVSQGIQRLLKKRTQSV